MKKYLPIVLVAVLIAVGAGLVLARDNNGSPANEANQDSSNSDMKLNENHNQAAPPASETPNQTTSTNSVTISDFAFSPATLTVKKGTTVTWTNKDSVAHTVTSDTGNMLDSPLFSAGETFSFTFNEVGTFSYHCTPHPQMKGTVIVTD